MHETLDKVVATVEEVCKVAGTARWYGACGCTDAGSNSTCYALWALGGNGQYATVYDGYTARNATILHNCAFERRSYSGDASSICSVKGTYYLWWTTRCNDAVLALADELIVGQRTSVDRSSAP